VTVRKNKVAPPFKEVHFDVMYGEGISKEGSLLDVGIEQGVVQKSGAWFAYGDERLGQGRENAKQFLKENDEVRERILDDVYEKLGLSRPGSMMTAAEPGAAEPEAEPEAEPGVQQVAPGTGGRRLEEPAERVF
jgi:recombination protein RecA